MDVITDDRYYRVYGFMKRMGLQNGELEVYAIIYSFSNADKPFIGSLEYLSEWTGFSVGHVCRILKSLCAKGFLLKDNNRSRPGKTSVYTAVIPTAQRAFSRGEPAQASAAPPRTAQTVQLCPAAPGQKNKRGAPPDTQKTEAPTEEKKTCAAADLTKHQIGFDVLSNPELTKHQIGFDKTSNNNKEISTADNKLTERARYTRGARADGGERENGAPFSAPSFSQVLWFIAEERIQTDPQQVWDYYDRRGWTENGAPIADWKEAVRKWEGRYTAL